MFKNAVLLILVVLLASFLFAEVVKGPFVDTIYYNTRMKEEIGLKDTAEGLTDIFVWGVNGPTLFAMSEEDIAKLDLYNVPSGSWSLLMNPIPNEAPYQVEVEGTTYFNPFAIREIRFAMNFLLNRQYIVDEILGGAGKPMFTMATPGQPGTTRYNAIVQEFGFTGDGDEEEAINVIDNAMKMAAELPENKGRLIKKDGLWTFDGKTELAAIKFLIRVDDPNGRLIEGNYVSDQLEKAGIPVERLYWDRSKTGTVVYGGNPADYEWGMYTEGWGAGATRRWWEHIVCQMYAPWYGYMPGGADPSHWNYTNPEMDELTKNAYYGKYTTAEEYWTYAIEGLRNGLVDAVRIYVCSQEDFYTANKARFEERFAYGLGDGLNQWSFITAKTDDKKLTVTQFSAQGSLFMAMWDPLGTGGFSDSYSLYIANNLTDIGSFESPVTAESIPYRAKWDLNTLETVVENVDGEIVGMLDVPPEAVKYDSMTKTWKEVGEGVKAQSVCAYTFNFSNYHNGVPMTVADLFYFNALISEWANQDGEDDKWYDPEYSSYMISGIDLTKGWILNDDGSMTVYFDYNFPADLNRCAARGVPDFSPTAAGQQVGVSWDIYEALSRMVVNGGVSGSNWNFKERDPEEVDVLVPKCVEDIRAELQKMHNEGHIPLSIKDMITVEEAKAAYKASIDFIDKYGNAYISNGPFFIKEYDPASNFMELAAFRDPTYPFTAQYWVDMFAVPRLVINNVEVPAYLFAGDDLNVTLVISKIVYPSIDLKDADGGMVKISLDTGEEPIIFETDIINGGKFDALIPGDMLGDVESGNYKLTIETVYEGALPVTKVMDILFY